jgi:putative spermidine/putrescine transport system permease protein
VDARPRAGARVSRTAARFVDIAWLAAIVLAYAVMLAPIVVVVFSSFSAAESFRFPPREYSLVWYEEAFRSVEYAGALRVSAIVGGFATLISVTLGSLAAYALVRCRFPGRATIEAVLLSPLALPHIVWAIALLQIYSWIRISGSIEGLILAHATLTLPFTVRIMTANFAQIDPSLEAAAASLGASPWRVARHVTLPLTLPALLTSALFTFLTSLNEVTVSAFIAGSRYLTFPVRVYAEMRSEGIDPVTIAISALIVLLIFVLGVAGERFFKWSRRI